MALTKKEWVALENKAADLRELCLQTVIWAGGGHLGGSLSSADILTLLYYKYANFDPKNPEDPDRDRVVVSKGHIGIILAPLFCQLGLLEKEELKSFNLTGSRLGIHLNCNEVTGLDSSTGSLGHGSSMALGMALAARVNKKDYKTFLILGDGECNEGSVWEAAMATHHFNATNLITIVDRNHFEIDGNTEDVMKLEPFADKWKAFGFDTLVVDGHDMNKMSDALEYAFKAKDKPVCIILDTIKGCGISFAAGNYKWHYGAFDEGKGKIAFNDLKKMRADRIAKAEKEGK